MTRMTVAVDEQILEEARTLLGAPTKRETIDLALREAIRRRKRDLALRNAGRIRLDLSQKKLERIRRES